MIKIPCTRFFLVVSRKYPRGTVMTEHQYQAFYSTQMIAEDRLTHRIEEIDGESAFRFATMLDKRAERVATKQAKLNQGNLQ